MLPYLLTAVRKAGVMSSARPSQASIDIDSCAPFETIVVKTRSSVYELIVLRGDFGKVLVRGGEHFAKFCPALFVGSTRDSSPFERRTISIGGRMKFYVENLLIVTSAVQSLCRRSTTDARAHCAATA